MKRDTANGNQVTGTVAEGGGLIVEGLGAATIANSVFSGNTVTASRTAGGTDAVLGGLSLFAVSLTAGTGVATLSESIIAGNVLTLTGPGSEALGAGLFLVPEFGIGIFASVSLADGPPPVLTIAVNNTTISGNQIVENGDARGGAFGAGVLSLLPTGEVASISNSTITQNSITVGGGAGGGGGGIAGLAVGNPLTLTNDTISANTVSAGTGGIGDLGANGGGGLDSAQALLGTAGPAIVPASPFALANTIVSGNSANNVVGTNNCNVPLAITDNGGNLESDDSCGFTQAGSLNNANPNLGPLQDNGGPQAGVTGNAATVQTEALLPDSQAIDLGLAATCLAPPINDVDERTLPRYSALRGDCDSGAYDTGGIISPPVTIIGAIPAVAGHAARIGFAGSDQPGLPLAYITYQAGGATFTVRGVTVSCPNHCTGTTSGGVFIAQPGTATLTLSGVVSTVTTGHGSIAMGDKVTLTSTIVTTAYPTTHTITKVAISVTTPGGTPVLSDSWSAPFPFATNLILQLA